MPVESIDAEALAVVPQHALESLALAPARAAAFIAVAEGTPDAFSVLASVGQIRKRGAVYPLWTSAFPEDPQHQLAAKILAEDRSDLTGALLEACRHAEAWLAPSPRAIWAETVLKQALRCAKRSGGGLWGALTGIGLVSDDEARALDELCELLGLVFEARPAFLTWRPQSPQ